MMLTNKTTFFVSQAPLPVKRKHIVLTYNEASARARKSSTRSFTGLEHVENIYCFTKSDIDLPAKGKKYYAGSNQGKSMENVVLPPWSQVWQTDFKTKKKIYGLRRVRPGGPDPDGDDDDLSDDEDKRTDDTIEPVCYFTIPLKAIEELYHCFNLIGVIDCAADCGDKAIAACMSGILYTGVCMTDEHAMGLKTRIQLELYRLFLTEGSKLYHPKLAALVKDPRGHEGPTP